MVNTFDRIVIAVPDLQAAQVEYRQLLGAPLPQQARDKSPSFWFALPNTVIELVQSGGDTAVISGIVFGSETASVGDEVVENSLGLDIRLCSGASTSGLRARHPDIEAGDFRVDHLVLRTTSAADCIDLFGRQLGIRLALDQSVPQWGGRMLFFRTGKLTLEVIESQREKPAEDYFWGIAYQCADLEKTAARLTARGVALSGIRAGRKQGSVVATLKSHCLGIPTLLIGPG
jgi:catechol 2,3-dioxygenase-like lactoylglutathione lyase family enzyme